MPFMARFAVPYGIRSQEGLWDCQRVSLGSDLPQKGRDICRYNSEIGNAKGLGSAVAGFPKS